MPTTFQPATRDQVYAAIDTERAYQDALPPTRTDTQGEHSVGEHLVLLKEYVDRALKAWVDNPGDDPALHVVRKVAGIAVRCMEQHGAPKR